MPGPRPASMTPNQYPSFIIVGIRVDGQRFRPSDWSERLAGTIATINLDRRMVYSPYVQPGQYENQPCVYVNSAIRQQEPLAYAFLENFARDNELKVVKWAPEEP